MGRFEIRDQFYLDGKPFQIISGAIHYFRVVPEYWRDRLLKLRAMGCNTVETYIPWNLHEPAPGVYDFSGQLDVARFLKTAQEVGLYAIVRPAPFICAEWEFGGQPAWLLAEENIPVRTVQGPFLSLMERYYRRLFPILTPLQIDQGGPILLMQVENEYGSFGEDKTYLRRMAEIMRQNGATVPFITSDNLENDFSRGSFEGALTTANFGSGAKEKFEKLRPCTNGGPLMCAEFWVGWFDAWGDEAHHTAPFDRNAQDLDDILSQGSVNIYMFHGGTNFGFMNGSNDYERQTPDVTSYDYDAPLTEDGRITPKYRAFQSVIAKHAPIPHIQIEESQRKAYGPAAFQGRASIPEVFYRLSPPQMRETPCSMERLGQSYGYILYSRTLERAVSALQFDSARDRVQVFADGRLVLTLFDREILGPHPVKLPAGTQLDILVENLGRVNYGPKLNHQRKGIDGPVLADGIPLSGWECRTLPLTDLKELSFEDSNETTPGLYRFLFSAGEKADTYLSMEGWGKGCVFLNGFNLGRYWDIGPQKRLYIPAPLLKAGEGSKGENELIVLETEGKSSRSLWLMDCPDLG